MVEWGRGFSQVRSGICKMGISEKRERRAVREEIREHIKDTREQARVRSQKGGMVEKRVGP